METRETETLFCHKHPGRIIIVRLVGGAVMALLFFLLFGFVIQWLWNRTITIIFSTPSITYWQSVGIIILSRVLFGCGSHNPFNGQRLHEHVKRLHEKHAGCQDVDRESLKGYIDRMAQHKGCKQTGTPENSE